MDDPQADAISRTHLADSECPVVRRGLSGNAVLVTDPPYHAGGKRFTGRAGQTLAGELGDDLFVIVSFRHGPDFSNERSRIADRLGVVRPLPNPDCFRRSALPTDLQMQELWFLWVLDDGNIAD